MSELEEVQKNNINYILERYPLPPGITFYKVGSTMAFPVRGVSEGTISFIMYMVRKPTETDKEWLRYAIEYDLSMSKEELISKLDRASKKFQEAILSREIEKYKFDADGGDLGREIKE